MGKRKTLIATEIERRTGRKRTRSRASEQEATKEGDKRMEEVTKGFVVAGLSLFLFVLARWLLTDSDRPNPPKWGDDPN
jgi:hypothetical protein